MSRVERPNDLNRIKEVLATAESRATTDSNSTFPDVGSEYTGPVADAIEERIACNPGDTVYFRTRRIVNEHDIDACPRTVSGTLSLLADGTDREIVVERTNPGAKEARWTAWRVEAKDGDGR